GELEVLAEALEVIARDPRGHSNAAGLLPDRPVVVRVAALDLMRGGGGSPQEVLGKTKAGDFGSQVGKGRLVRAHSSSDLEGFGGRSVRASFAPAEEDCASSSSWICVEGVSTFARSSASLQTSVTR